MLATAARLYANRESRAFNDITKSNFLFADENRKTHAIRLSFSFAGCIRTGFDLFHSIHLGHDLSADSNILQPLSFRDPLNGRAERADTRDAKA